MLSTGEFFAKKIWKNTNADLFAGFSALLVDFVKDTQKELTIVLDNASFHKNKIMKDAIKFFKTKGVNFYFLPAYSPELNRIESLWHKMKYTWMPAKRRTKSDLEDNIGEIIDGFGGKYKFKF